MFKKAKKPVAVVMSVLLLMTMVPYSIMRAVAESSSYLGIARKTQ